MSVVFGMFLGSIWVMYAAGLWYGGKKVADAEASPGQVFSAFFGILLGTISLAQISPNIGAVAEARGAAGGLYQILDRPSAVDASKDDGIVPVDCKGEIEALHVHFTYPSRPDAPILNDYNVKIASGQTVAFVGASGGGKSTLIALLERFYAPQSGQILLDGRDISTLQVRWLRSQIGLVSQEPVLFATSIFDNIAAGGDGITRDQVVAAAKLANAHDFIMGLPEQYDTLVGEKGVSLSGGQKQRVAIARAVVRNPKILVLDEATSALDAESERVVQAALNQLMDQTQMTTLVIAHRLSTIRRADKIVVLAGGRVVEQGPHDELLRIDQGVYKNLYTIQEGAAAAEDAQMEADRTNGDVDVSDADHAKGIERKDSELATERVDSRRSGSGGGHPQAPPAATTAATSATASSSSKGSSSFSIARLFALSAPERKYFVIGVIAAAMCGASMPGSAILISSVIGTMTKQWGKYLSDHDKSHLHDMYVDVRMYGIIYVCGAVALFVFTAIQQYCFKYMAEKLTSRLRGMHFEALCRQNIGFFDFTEHATGALTADLAINATKVAMLSGDAQGRLVQALFTFLAAIGISFGLGSWLLTLVMLAVFPLLIFGQMVRMKSIKGSDAGSDLLAESGAHASQALSNIRTVVSLGLEKSLLTTYNDLLEAPLRDGSREAQINGLALGFSSFIMFAVYSLVFWYGGQLVKNDHISFQQLIRTLMAIMMSAQGIGSAASWLADAGNADVAGAAIFDLVERPVPINAFDDTGVVPTKVHGKFEFQHIEFRYPTRPDITVLKNYNLTVEPGQTVAFCGPSGGGKSTCIALIERFYDPTQGQVLLDGVDTKDLNLHWLRSQIGLVGQEPTLFIGTIADNIAYGLERQPTPQEVEQAAKMANAHAFITAFPDGYATQVGMKGEQLSGGQKQRIAIARAILKNPAILLLDEATSALDTESEKIVQDALDKVVALQKRTTIIIAHRLSTIRKADKICVVSGGKIAEQGTHTDLMALNGIYTRLVESANK